jgi:hypothetical protein
MICENVVIDWRDENPLRENKASLPPWRAKEKAVERSSGYIQSDRAQRRAGERPDQANNALCETRPTTVEGLRAKAKAGHVSQCDSLWQQVMCDIGVMFGDLNQNEEPIEA